MKAQGEIHYIDPRVDHVGVSRLRQLDAKTLKASTHDKTLVIRERDEPLAVLLSYDQYLVMQNQIDSVMETLEMLSNQGEMTQLLTGLKEAASGECENLEDIRKALKSEPSPKKR